MSRRFGKRRDLDLSQVSQITKDALLQGDLLNPLDFNPQIFRAQVVQIDFSGGRWNGSPRNSVQAALYRPGLSLGTSTDGGDDQNSQVGIFYPMFDPFIQLPIKKGEFVYVLLEQETPPSGVWICRVTEKLNNQLINYIDSSEKFRNETSTEDKKEYNINNINANYTEDDIGNLSNFKSASGLQEKVLENAYIPGIEISPEKGSEESRSVYESVPRWIKRGGELVLMGSNDAMVVLGIDRPGSVDGSSEVEGGLLPKRAGTVDIIAGRHGARVDKNGRQITAPDAADGVDAILDFKEGDPSFDFDRARIYVSMKSDVDENFKVAKHLVLPGHNENVDPPILNYDGDNERSGKAAADVMKADNIRILAREDIKIQSYNLQKIENVEDNVLNKHEQVPGKIGSSIILKKDGTVLIETQNKKGFVRISDDDIQINMSDAAQDDAQSFVSSIGLNNKTKSVSIGVGSPINPQMATATLDAQGNVTVDGLSIKLGKDAINHVVLGEKLVELLAKLLAHTHPPAIPTVPVAPSLDGPALVADLPAILSKVVWSK